MIYTIGRTEVYEITFRQATEENPPTKVGARSREGYKGGSVWKTEEEARRVARQQRGDFTVYGVVADWDEDVREVEGKSHGELLHDAELVRTS